MAIVTGIDPNTGQPRNLVLTPDGGLPVSELGGGMSTTSLLEEILLELRKLRMGMVTANDSVCNEVEGELTPIGVSEE